jgi:hypothetical protein
MHVLHDRILLRPLTVAVLACVAGCTANPFLAGYRGERMAPVAEARVVQEAPAAGAATELGSSRFQASNGTHFGDAEAVDAARDVGADLVKWEVKQLTREEWVENDPVYERRASGRGQFASYVPIPGTRERWSYSARFWRSITASPGAPGVPAAPKAAEPGTPVPAQAPGGG